MQFNIDSKIYLKYIQIICALVCMYLLLPSVFTSLAFLCETEKPLVSSCLDPSWALSINWALEKQLVFGKDYIFTYGPLGFLSTRVPLGLNSYYLIVFDMFVLTNLGYILSYTFKKFSRVEIPILCMLFCYSIAGAGMYLDQVVFVLLIISVFWLNKSLIGSYWNLVVPIITTILLFYIKVNVGFVSIVIFYLFICFGFFKKLNHQPKRIILAISVPFFIILLSYALKVSILGYILGGLSLIDGYNDAMNLKAGDYFIYLCLAILMIITIFVSLFLKNIKLNLINFLTLLIVTFILFKQGFVRSDLHIVVFFSNFPFVCGIIILFYEGLTKYQSWIIGGLFLFCLLISLELNSLPKITDRLEYLKAIVNNNNLEKRFNENFTRFNLPSNVSSLVGNKSIDIIPWNIDYLYFNRLNYNPRPIIQSYSAYTPYLIKLNGEKYESDSAPEFVFFSNQSIDGRYAFFDDQEVKLSLLKNYICIGMFGEKNNEFLLFKRSINNTRIEFVNVENRKIQFGEFYYLNDITKHYFIKININYSVSGKAIRFLYKPFPITITFLLADDTIRQYRVIVPIISNGVLINPLIENEEDFQKLTTGENPNLTKTIKGFKIESDTKSNSANIVANQSFSQEIKLIISEMKIKRGNQ